MAEQSPDDPAFDLPASDGESIRREEVEHDVIVIACVKSDVVTPGFGDGSDDVDGSIAVERGDLDGDDILDFGEPAPEMIRQVRATNGFLKVKANQWNDTRRPRGSERVEHRRHGQNPRD